MWLSSDILDSELCLPGYHLFRLDRNRHGGGILMFVHSLLSCKLLICNGMYDLEFMAMSVNAQPLISIFYLSFLLATIIICFYF